VHDLDLGVPLAGVASFTIIYGSLRALQQSDIKRRLAFSTVSQVSYIALGAALLGPFATIGGIVHVVHQGLMKITLFFCAGALSKQLHVHRIEELDGAGRRMPWTMLAFSIGGLGMIGVPPLAGFITKWYLGIGALQAGQAWVVLVLAASSLLNAAYFLPPIYRAWFLPGPVQTASRHEQDWWLVGPAVVTALAVVLTGVLAGLTFSPLGWATLIVERQYLP
jgi:multicomponent Na+:H+ antiporter subunit D